MQRARKAALRHRLRQDANFCLINLYNTLVAKQISPAWIAQPTVRCESLFRLGNARASVAKEDTRVAMAKWSMKRAEAGPSDLVELMMRRRGNRIMARKKESAAVERRRELEIWWEVVKGTANGSTEKAKTTGMKPDIVLGIRGASFVGIGVWRESFVCVFMECKERARRQLNKF